MLAWPPVIVVNSEHQAAGAGYDGAPAPASSLFFGDPYPGLCAEASPATGRL